MREKIGAFTKTFGGRSMTALAIQIEQECREIIPRVTERQSAKIIAFKAGSTQRSAENWQAGLCLPQVPHFLALANQIPELKAKVLEWLGASARDSGENPPAVLDQIAKLLQRGQ